MTRVRTRGEIIKGDVNRKTWDQYGTLIADYNTLTDGVSQYKSNTLESITDTVTPNFRKEVASGKIVMNSVSIHKANATSPQRTWNSGFIPDWGTFQLSGDIVSFYVENPPDPTSYTLTTAAAKAWTLQGAYSDVSAFDFMSLVSVAEAGKTASMLRKPFDGALSILRKVDKRKADLMAKGMKYVDAATKAWLEYRFGWKPLLYDIQGIQQAYVNSTSAYLKPVRLVARRNFKQEYKLAGDPYTHSTAFFGGVPMKRDKTLQTKVRSGVLYESFDESLSSANARHLGLRLADVPASVWELVPYSFVVDRFISVGDWLNAIQPKPGVRILGDWTTVKNTAMLRCTMQNYTFLILNTNVTFPGGDSWTENSTGTSRYVDQSMSSFVLPAWNPNALNWKQYTDHLALIKEYLGRVRHL